MKKGNTVGMDLGDQNHVVCMLDAKGDVVEQTKMACTAKAIRKYFEKQEPCVVAIEAGTHSAWVSRLLEELGHEVLVGNPRRLRVIWESSRKNDCRPAPPSPASPRPASRSSGSCG